MTHEYVWYDSWICVTWHDSWICVRWHDSWICMTGLMYVWHDSKNWFMCDMTHASRFQLHVLLFDWYVWLGPVVSVIRLICTHNMNQRTLSRRHVLLRARRWFVCIYTYVCMYQLVHIYIFLHTYLHTFTYIHTYIYAHIYICTYIYMHIYIYAKEAPARACIHIYIPSHTVKVIL